MSVEDLVALLKSGDLAGAERVLDAHPGLPSQRGSDGFTPLHLAAHFGWRDACELLLARGADVAAVASNAMGVQPLHAAVAGRHAPIVALLLAKGAPVDARQQFGFTPLHGASANGDPESVRLLLKAGADARLAADDGRTPLELARASRRADLIVPMIEAALGS